MWLRRIFIVGDDAGSCFAPSGVEGADVEVATGRGNGDGRATADDLGIVNGNPKGNPNGNPNVTLHQAKLMSFYCIVAGCSKETSDEENSVVKLNCIHGKKFARCKTKYKCLGITR